MTTQINLAVVLALLASLTVFLDWMRGQEWVRWYVAVPEALGVAACVLVVGLMVQVWRELP